MARFKEHPWTTRVTVAVEDRAHPITSMLGPSFSIEDEIYTFRENPRPHAHVLMRLEAASVGASGDYPLAWTRAYGSGRVYYNALGHFAATWSNPLFLRQIVEAIVWAGGTSTAPPQRTIRRTRTKGASHGFEVTPITVRRRQIENRPETLIEVHELLRSRSSGARATVARSGSAASMLPRTVYAPDSNRLVRRPLN